MTENTPSGNVGEWSELYTLAFLLVNGGAYAADKKQNRCHNPYSARYKLLS
jgi:hypothetical protein